MKETCENCKHRTWQNGEEGLCRMKCLNYDKFEPIKPPQQRIYDAVVRRGYRAGWSPEQFAARQLVKLQEELSELADNFGGLPDDLADMFTEIGRRCREAFDRKSAWHKAHVIAGCENDVEKEIADVVVVAMVIAQEMHEMTGEPFDVVAAAVEKSGADVERGVR